MRGCGQIILHYALFILHYYRFAAVAELADAPDLGSGVNDVGVQVPLAAPKIGKPNGLPYFFFKNTELLLATSAPLFRKTYWALRKYIVPYL